MSPDFQPTGDIFGKHVRLATAITAWKTLDGRVDKKSTSNKLVVIFRAPQGITVKPFHLVFKGDLTPENIYLSPEDMDVFAENRDAVKRLHHRQVHETTISHTSAKQNVPKRKVKRSGLDWLLEKLPIIQLPLAMILSYGEAKISADHQLAKLLPNKLSEAPDQEFPTVATVNTSDDTPNGDLGNTSTDDNPSRSKEEQERLEKANPANRTQALDKGSNKLSNARSTAGSEIEDASNNPEPQASDQLASGETFLLALSTVISNHDNNHAIANESVETPIEEEDQPSSQGEIPTLSEESVTTSDIGQQAVDQLTDSHKTEGVQDIDDLSEPSSLPTLEKQPVPPGFGNLSASPEQREQPQTDDPSEAITLPGEEAVSIDDKTSSPSVQPTADRGSTVNQPTSPAQDKIVRAPDPNEIVTIPEENSEDTSVSDLPKESSRKQDSEPIAPGKRSNTLSHKPGQTPNPVKEEQPVNQPPNKRPKPHNRNDFESLDPSEASAEKSVIAVITIKSATDNLTSLRPEDPLLLPEESSQRPWRNDLILSNSLSHSSTRESRSLDDSQSYDWHQLEQENGLITTPSSFPSIEGSPYHIGSSERVSENCFDERRNPDPCNLPNPGDSLDLNIDEL